MMNNTILTLIFLLAFILIALIINKRSNKKNLYLTLKVRLMPYWIKFFGLLIASLSIILNWLNEFKNIQLLEPFWHFGLIIGLLLICLSKEKTEDEMLVQLRLNSVFISFFGGIIAHVIFLLIDLLFGSSVDSFNSLYVISFILMLLATR